MGYFGLSVNFHNAKPYETASSALTSPSQTSWTTRAVSLGRLSNEQTELTNAAEQRCDAQEELRGVQHTTSRALHLTYSLLYTHIHMKQKHGLGSALYPQQCQSASFQSITKFKSAGCGNLSPI